jgi:WD40 repeat protein
MGIGSFVRLRPLVPLLPLLLTGCVPGVGWLPDSGGFVYSAGKDGNQLRLYDLKTGKSRILAVREADPTCPQVSAAWPQVSPDGKRIALAQATGGVNALYVFIYDLDGKEVHRSGHLEWAGRRFQTNSFTTPQVYWSPKGDRLLLCWDGRTGLYELATQTVTPLEGDVIAFGDSAVRPDGKLFLLTTSDPEQKTPEFFVGDWDGKVRPLAGPRQWPDDRTFPRRIGLFPWLYGSGWDGATATASWNGHRLRIDTDKRTFDFDRIEVHKTPDGKVIQHQVTLTGGAVVRLVEVSPRRDSLSKPAELGRCRVEVLRPDAAKADVVLEEAEIVTFHPSPDRRAVAVRWSEKLSAAFKPDEGKSGIVVLSGKGEVLARINTHDGKE